MERAKKIIAELRLRPQPVTEQDILHALREYIQTLILKLVFQSRFGAALSFMGGTALRICYDIKRYSEDLDFALDNKSVPYRFATLVQTVRKELQLRGFDVTATAHEDKVVQKGFFHFSGLGWAFGLHSFSATQKLHVKIEVDIRPPTLKKGERESFFVNRFQEIFPILKHSLPTLFAGKVLALLFRPYARGRDYYDLIWYLSRKTPLNLDYLNHGSKKKHFKNSQQVFKAVEDKINATKPNALIKDLEAFLEDPSEKQWMIDIKKVFKQLTK